ncbi:apolipoprotein N-acyltransferase [Novosphingobium sp. 9]|uniref:apolipoprotein N-acyltransferase n=1 Tax=Novosphingobium sp. 9 TaxID=2025349 RepID=UPI0021B69D84|nr:apolipoprotein N-acyltransferase [Novosphingobium sp. 9]
MPAPRPALSTFFRRVLTACLDRPRVSAVVLGALAACGFQPLQLWPLTLLAIALLIELIARAERGRRAFLIGWLFGLGHFTLGNNWIATAFTYQAAMPTWLGGIAVFLLALYLALFPAFATLIAWAFLRVLSRRAAPLTPPRRALALTLAFAAAWIFTEWVRSWLFTGFPWNPLGVALLGPFSTPGLAILTRWVGTYGLSGVLVLLAGLPALFMRLAAAHTGTARAARLAPPLIGLAALTALMVLPAAWAPAAPGKVRYTLVQPDLRQEVLDDPQQFEASFVKLAKLTMPNGVNNSGVDSKRLVLWPESGVSDYLRDGYPPYFYVGFTYADDPAVARWRIGRVIGPQSLLLTGAVDLVAKNDMPVAARNSVTALDGDGDILAGYSKAHLVPYGEYLPMRSILEPLGLSRLVEGDIDFLPGPGPRTFDFGDYGKAGIQICYEIVFSGHVVDPRDRPDYIFNPSNDGWFGYWGPPQHLAQARLRAIEEGLPVLRSTTTGISAVVDADGVVRNFAPWRTAKRLDGFIPRAHAPTLFARFGNALPLALAAMLAILAACVVAPRRRRA